MLSINNIKQYQNLVNAMIAHQCKFLQVTRKSALKVIVVRDRSFKIINVKIAQIIILELDSRIYAKNQNVLQMRRCCQLVLAKRAIFILGHMEMESNVHLMIVMINKESYMTVRVRIMNYTLEHKIMAEIAHQTPVRKIARLMKMERAKYVHLVMPRIQ